MPPARPTASALPAKLDAMSPVPPKAGDMSILPAPPKPQFTSPSMDQLRSFSDVSSTRKAIYDSVLAAASAIQPISNEKHTLRLNGVRYIDPELYSNKQHKDAVLGGKTMGRRLKGTWELMDNITGQVIDARDQVLANVPYVTKYGTMVHNGSEYTLTAQQRLKPGVYTRIKSNGELEAHANVLPGKGISHRYMLNPETNIYKLKLGQGELPLMPLLKSMGATDAEIKDAWGDQIYAANYKENDAAVVQKLKARLLKAKDLEGDETTTRQKLTDVFDRMELDPFVTKRTLGTAFDRMNKDAILATTKKLLAVSRGEQDVDDRDHLAYQTFHGPEDLLRERVERDHSGMRRAAFYKASFQNSLKSMPTGVMTPQLEQALLGSGLGQNLEEINPAEILDKHTKITRLGEGGIPSMDAIPDEARSVQPSHMGFMDPVRTPESMRAGVDTHIARGARKGPDGKIYAQFRDLKTGETVWRSPQELADVAVAFPGALKGDDNRVPAMKSGKITYVPRDEIDYELPAFEDAFSALGNLIPIKSAVKAQRMAMASRMLTQALPLKDGEAPFVRGALPGTKGTKDFEHEFGVHMGAVRAAQDGQITDISDGIVKLRYADGSKDEVELFQNHPFNRKTMLHQSTALKPGDMFKQGQTIVRSNFTDKDGAMALGLNARTAYMPWKGYNFEDANVISEGMAKRMSSEHMYQHELEVTDLHKMGKRNYMSLFPQKYDKQLLDTMDDDGVIKVGQTVTYDQPLILGAQEKESPQNKIHKQGARAFGDVSVLWKHHDPGVVTDIVQSKNGPVVLVKSIVPTQVGDKMCYDPETEVLTYTGWKKITQVLPDDFIASLHPELHVIEYVAVAEQQAYAHTGRMYRLETTQVDLLVTDNHKLFAKTRYAADYALIEAKDLWGTRYKHKRNGVWLGETPEYVTLPALTVAAGQAGNGTRDLPEINVPAHTYAMLLGMFLSEGNLVHQPEAGNYGFDVTQIKTESRTQLLEALEAAKISYTIHSNNTKIRIYSKQWYKHLQQFGAKAPDKFIPEFMFMWGKEALELLLQWLFWGDGHVSKTGRVYTTTSPRLADGVQRLCLHLGMSANITSKPACRGTIKGKEYDFKECFKVVVFSQKNEPEINHGHAKSQAGQTEAWVDYTGMVYCLTLVRNHVLYVRRNGKPVWCGNSGRYGDKGVIAAIVPDHQMPTDAQGRPFEVLLNPLGIVTRTNPAQKVELMLGKIAELTGKSIAVPDFEDIEDMTEWAEQQLKKYNLKGTENILDVTRNQYVNNVATGNRFYMKLHHTAESKGQGRGSGAYSSEDAPAKGGESGSKRISMLDVNALLSHGATETIRDAGLIRGQKNEEYWTQFMQGHTPIEPKVPLIYEKFVNSLKAAGINVVSNGQETNVMAMTNSDVKQLAADRVVRSGETVRFDKNMEPIAGGLFDPKLTGGHSGRQWAKIELPEPTLNPVMEEPARRLLGLTQQQLRDTIGGEHILGRYGTGPQAIANALSELNVKREIDVARAQVNGSNKAARDNAIRRLGYLKGAEKYGLHPKDWILDAVPVLPPIFRPVTVMGSSGIPLVADPNYLYKELLDATANFKSMKDMVGLNDTGSERLAIYDSFKAITGLGDPIHPKLQEKNVSGILKSIFGSSPKFGTVQRKLLSSTVDNVGRSVITPNPDYDMDTVGIPEGKAFEVYNKFLIRRLKRLGMPMGEALRHVKDKTALAKDALLKEMETRPVFINRAPVLHRFGIMAFKPRLVSGDVMQISPLIVKGFNADFDGDAMQFHVPTSEAAVREAYDRMMPSKNLFHPADFKSVVHGPVNEYIGGLYHASSQTSERKPRVFASKQDAIAAYKRGDIQADDPVEIIQ